MILQTNEQVAKATLDVIETVMNGYKKGQLDIELAFVLIVDTVVQVIKETPIQSMDDKPIKAN